MEKGSLIRTFWNKALFKKNCLTFCSGIYNTNKELVFCFQYIILLLKHNVKYHPKERIYRKVNIFFNNNIA